MEKNGLVSSFEIMFQPVGHLIISSSHIGRARSSRSSLCLSSIIGLAVEALVCYNVEFDFRFCTRSTPILSTPIKKGQSQMTKVTVILYEKFTPLCLAFGRQLPSCFCIFQALELRQPAMTYLWKSIKS